MDPRLLGHYNRELQHLREMGAEFAKAFPKIAGRLGMEGIEVHDPYVERLLEGTAFLAARVQLKLDAEFPRFSQRLLGMLYPHYMAPTPAMLIAKFQPILTDTNLATGSVVPRGTVIRGAPGKNDFSPSQFNTAHALTLWPVELVEASYFSFAPDLPLAGLPLRGTCKGGIRLRLRCSAGLNFSQTRIDALRFYLGGSEDVAFKLHELIGSACLGVLQGVGERGRARFGFLPRETVSQPGFSDDEALLPVSTRNFGGYRLLQEYFSLPQRYLFLRAWAGLSRSRAGERYSQRLELVVLFDAARPGSRSVVDASELPAATATPAINLFEKRDRPHPPHRQRQHEFHVVPDRTRPTDFELYDLIRSHRLWHRAPIASSVFRAVLRRLLMPPTRSRTATIRCVASRGCIPSASSGLGARTDYIGSEVFLSLVDPNEAPYRTDLRQISLLCSMHKPRPAAVSCIWRGASDFSLESRRAGRGDPLREGTVATLFGGVEGAQAWSFISQLSLNYLSLLDTDARQGAAALRELLGLYATSAEVGMHKQVDGLRSIRCEPVITRLPMPDRCASAVGCRSCSRWTRCFSKAAAPSCSAACWSISWLATSASTASPKPCCAPSARGEIMHWPARCGLRPIL
jgi:type VI secretion system protein ImpG